MPAGRLKLVELLKSSKADVSIQNKQGKTPADVAKTPEVAAAVLAES